MRPHNALRPCENISGMRPHLIGIAGPSGAGKGELSSWLAGRLGGVILDLDGYYREQGHIPFEVRCLMDYDQPSALDTDLLFGQMARLAAGEAIQKPVYDFSRHTRAAETLWFAPSPCVILEGLFTLYWPELRALLGTKIFIDAPDDVCLQRRIARDTTQRGREKGDVERQFYDQVLPAAIRHVRPTAQYADLVLDGLEPWEKNGGRVLGMLPALNR